ALRREVVRAGRRRVARVVEIDDAIPVAVRPVAEVVRRQELRVPEGAGAGAAERQRIDAEPIGERERRPHLGVEPVLERPSPRARTRRVRGAAALPPVWPSTFARRLSGSFAIARRASAYSVALPPVFRPQPVST